MEKKVLLCFSALFGGVLMTLDLPMVLQNYFGHNANVVLESCICNTPDC